MLGLASCGLASASLPCGSLFPPSPLDLLKLEAFHGLSLPQAKLQIAERLGEACHSRPWPAVWSQCSEVGLEMGGFTLEALLGLIPEDQELNLTSWTRSLRLAQPTSMLAFAGWEGWVTLGTPSQPVLFLVASRPAPPVLEGCVCTRSLRRPGPVTPKVEMLSAAG